MTEYCAVIGHALYRAGQQTAVKEVTRPLPSLAEWGVATRDYISTWHTPGFCSSVGQKTYKKDNQHVNLIQYHYHSWGAGHIPVANDCVSEA